MKEISFIMPTTPKIIKAVIAGSGGFVGSSAVSLAFLRDQINKAGENIIPLKNFGTAADVKRALYEGSP